MFGVFQEMYIQFQIFLPKKFHNFSLNKNIFLFNPALFNLHNWVIYVYWWNQAWKHKLERFIFANKLLSTKLAPLGKLWNDFFFKGSYSQSSYSFYGQELPLLIIKAMLCFKKREHLSEDYFTRFSFIFGLLTMTRTGIMERPMKIRQATRRG